ncbi:MAG: type II toxin-antitoxin system prevent-host-death family antitoxin [Chloroflexi bacterium]|nr:type II toxin-antitoxin system prevent-host-death family antitoxin [Chloroflexota bacterium]
MNTKTVDIQEAQTQFLHLLALALQGDDIVITEDNVPLVRLVPVQPQPLRRIADLHKGAIRMRADFNDPLPDEFWLGDA